MRVDVLVSIAIFLRPERFHCSLIPMMTIPKKVELRLPSD